MRASTPTPTVGLLGMGRLGRSLAALLPEAGYAVAPWRRGEPFPECEVAWLTVSDEAVAEVAQALPVGPVVLHASGALDLSVLAPHERAGSLHLLQSFPGPERAIPPTEGVPAAIAGHPEALAWAERIARDLGLRPFRVPGDRRLYHAAAVLAGNFATTLLDLASEVLAASGVDRAEAPGLLAPLALASLRQAAQVGPVAALTGPFARGDSAVVAAHLAALERDLPDIRAIYELLGQRTAQLAEEGGLSEACVQDLRRALAQPDEA